jgi:hypothetical protein
MNRIIILLIFISAFSITFIRTAANGKEQTKTFKGEIINFTDEYIELKKGKKDITLYFSDNSKIISPDGKKAGKDIIAPCQIAKAYYINQDGKKIIVKLKIMKINKCRK